MLCTWIDPKKLATGCPCRCLWVASHGVCCQFCWRQFPSGALPNTFDLEMKRNGPLAMRGPNPRIPIKGMGILDNKDKQTYWRKNLSPADLQLLQGWHVTPQESWDNIMLIYMYPGTFKGNSSYSHGISSPGPPTRQTPESFKHILTGLLRCWCQVRPSKLPCWVFLSSTCSLNRPHSSDFNACHLLPWKPWNLYEGSNGS